MRGLFTFLMPKNAVWKGNGRSVDVENRDEGTGGTSGIALSLKQVETGGSDVTYTVPVKVGAANQLFSLQVDTGSSDLWIASRSCSTSSCGQAHLYDPDAATATNANFSISYFSGSVSGPIFWDSVTIGDYTIKDQALAAVNDVQTEPLSPNLSGVLGIALPLNSLIAADIPPATSSSPGGASWASNLFSINTAPSFHFLSLALSRPGSNQVQSVLGIGEHPTALVPDPSLIQYETPVLDGFEALFWKATVRAITVYVNGVGQQIQLGSSITGAVFPNAVLDSGTPLILTTTTVANAIYGSIGIGPAADGMYYVPCTTPLNMTITLDNRSETAIHPLDLTAEQSLNNQAKFCTGLIQTADSELSSPDSKADIILGVPFMRNVYTVMAYSAPNRNGSFSAVMGLSPTITPMLGLMALTDPTKALQEFHNVRVLNQAIDSDKSSPSMGGKNISVGIVVLISLFSFLGFCGLLFTIRWFLLRRAQRKAATRQSGDDDSGMDKVAYMLTRTSPSKREKAAGTVNYEGLSEEDLRKMRFESYMRRAAKISSLSTRASDRTKVGDYGGAEYGRVYDGGPDEFGLISPTKKTPVNEDSVWDPATGLDWGDNTLTQHPPRAYEIPPEPGPSHLIVGERQGLTASHRRNSCLAMQPLLASQSPPENVFDVDDNAGCTQHNTSNQRLMSRILMTSSHE